MKRTSNLAEGIFDFCPTEEAHRETGPQAESPAMPPEAVTLMNEGVKLALPDASTCDHLKDLEKAGAKILVCGTCTNHFGITENIGVGTISNMFEILEAITGADKVLSV